MTINRILPVGFYDLNFVEAKKHYEFIKHAVDSFIDNGYELIKTSIAEFVDNYPKSETSNVFKFIDPISKRIIFFRNDITLQIANYISSNQLIEYKTPLKLCYYGDIINLDSDELYYERQQTQVGCEIIGDNSLDSCYTIINDSLNILKKVKNINITITLPDFLNIFMQEIGASSDLNLKNSIVSKNISDIRKYAEKYGVSSIISEIILNNVNFDKLSGKINSIVNSDEIKNQLKAAKELMTFLNNNFSYLSINFDLFGDNKFSYHNKIAFDIFTDNFLYPIAKGGCYSINSHSKTINAVGSTIYTNFLRQI